LADVCNASGRTSAPPGLQNETTTVYHNQKTKHDVDASTGRASAPASQMAARQVHSDAVRPSHFFRTIPNHFKALNQNETRISNRDQPKVKNRFCKSDFNLELEKTLGWSKKTGMAVRVTSPCSHDVTLLLVLLPLRPLAPSCFYCRCMWFSSCRFRLLTFRNM